MKIILLQFLDNYIFIVIFSLLLGSLIYYLFRLAKNYWDKLNNCEDEKDSLK